MLILVKVKSLKRTDLLNHSREPSVGPLVLSLWFSGLPWVPVFHPWPSGLPTSPLHQLINVPVITPLPLISQWLPGTAVTMCPRECPLRRLTYPWNSQKRYTGNTQASSKYSVRMYGCTDHVRFSLSLVQITARWALYWTQHELALVSSVCLICKSDLVLTLKKKPSSTL